MVFGKERKGQNIHKTRETAEFLWTVFLNYFMNEVVWITSSTSGLLRVDTTNFPNSGS